MRTRRTSTRPPRGSLVRPGLTKRDAPSWRTVRARVVVPAFKALREHGVFASVQNLDCCGTCTAARLNDTADEWVGYHVQSVPDSPDEPFDGLYLQHCLEPDSKHVVRKALRDEGLVVDWDGSDTRTILVTLPEEPGTHWSRMRLKLRLRWLLAFWRELSAHLHAPTGRLGAAAVTAFSDGSVWDAEPVDAGEPGFTAAWHAVTFTRNVRFEPLRADLFGEHEPLDDEEGLFDDDPDGREQLERFVNGADVETVTLSNPVDGDGRELRGAELDAVAFRGSSIDLANYSVMGKAKDGDKDAVRTFTPLNGKSFTIAELMRVLEEHAHWLVRADQWARRFSPDHRFFEGLHELRPGVWDFEWGS